MRKTKSDVAHPHDLLVRNIFGEADLAADLLQNYLPSDVVSNVDLSSLRREVVESVDPSLSELLGDLRYSESSRARDRSCGCLCFSNTNRGPTDS